MTYTVGELFAGIGGFSRGLESAGFKTLWQVEIDDDAVGVLERHYPTVTRYRDIREVSGHGLPAVDVLVGGWPCQDLSVAGARAGLAGERSGLFFEVARLIGELAPRWVLFENVPGLLSSFTPVEPPPSGVAVGTEWEVEETADYGVVLSALAERHYGFAGRVLDARWLGVPQRRRRVFIVGCLGDSGVRASEVLFERDSGPWDPPPGRAQGQGSAAVPEGGAGVPGVSYALPASARGTGDGHGNAWNSTYIPAVGGLTSHYGRGPDSEACDAMVVEPTVAAFGGNRTAGAIDVAAAVNAHGGPHGRMDFESETFIVDATNATLGEGTDGTLTTEQGKGNRGQMVASPMVAFHLTQDPINGPESGALGAGSEDGCATIGVAFSENIRAEVRETDYANSLATSGGKPGQGYPAVRSGMAVRRLTPREAERLQGFPDDWTRYRADGRELNDGPRYRLIGNAVAVPVIAWIGRRLRVAMEAGDDLR